MKRSSKFLYRYSRYIKSIFFLWDIVLINVAFALSFYFRFNNFNQINSPEAKAVFVIINITWIALYAIVGAYKYNRVEQMEHIISKSTKFILLHLFVVFTLISLLNFDDVSRLRMIYFYSFFLIEVVVFRVIFIKILKKMRIKGYNFRKVIIIGAGILGQEIKNSLIKDLAYGYQVIGFFCDDVQGEKNNNILGKIADVKEYLFNHQIHQIYIATPNYDEEKIKDIINFCERSLIRVKFVPNFKKFTDSRKVVIDYYDNVPVVSLRKEPLEIPLNRIVKRLFDYSFSLILIIFIFPWLFPILMLLVKISSRGPIFFKQKRSGENNTTFYCYKFRTMKMNLNADQQQAIAGDNRITSIGKFLRKTNMDEFPQFFNVLFGHMSVVGPRPHMLQHTKEFSDVVDNYLVRHYTRPGITGMAQINGYRGETKTNKAVKKRVD